MNPEQSDIQTALAYHEAGNLELARRMYQDILAKQPDNAFIWYQLGLAHVNTQNYAEAEESLEKALSIKPDYAEALLALGFVCQEQGKPDDALANYRRVLSVKPDHTEAYLGIGIILSMKGKPDEALENYRKVVSVNPDHVEAYKGIGGILNDSGRPDEAIDVYNHALCINPNHTELYISLGNAYKANGDHDRAIQSYQKAVSMEPDNPRAHLYLGMVLILCGDFENGWKEYEWRWKAEPLISENRNYAAPKWNGSELNGRSIFVYCEQGYGDAIQFIRYIKYVKKCGGNILLECDRPLERLFSGISDISRLILKGNPVPLFDCHCPLLSLPHVFGTHVDTIPADIPYLAPDARTIEKWQNRFKHMDGLKVGIVWSGNPAHQKDRHRSIPLADLRRIIETPGASFVSLQVGSRADELKQSAFSDHVIDLCPELNDFADTAGAISALDLVIGVDTAVIHLAGALGRPVWLLVQYVPDCRWLLNREDTPWYPTMRLFRQETIGKWEPVIKSVAADLKQVCEMPVPSRHQILIPAQNTSRQSASHISLTEKIDKMNTEEDSPEYAGGSITAMKQCRYGRMLYVRNDMYVGRSLDLYGEFSEGEPVLFRQLIRPGDVVIEAGANIGAHTVFLAQTTGVSGAVIAYEPQRFIFQILCANVVLNELTNVYTRHAALGANPGIIGVPQLDYARSGNFGGLSLSAHQEGEPVVTETIDSLSLSRLRMIKADVEGMEIDVLKGAQDTIRRLRPVLYMENDRQEKSDALIQMIRDMDYRLWWHLPPLYNPENFAHVAENVFGNIVSINMLCIPREKPVNITGLREVTSCAAL